MIEKALKLIDLARERPSQHLLDVIYGPQARTLRAIVASTLMGQKVPPSSRHAQYGLLRQRLLNAFDIEAFGAIAEHDHEFEERAAKVLSEYEGLDDVTARIGRMPEKEGQK